MAEKNSGDAQVTTNTAAATSESKLVTGAEADKVVKSFYEGRMESGYTLQFKTKGGETVPEVRKLGK